MADTTDQDQFDEALEDDVQDTDESADVEQEEENKPKETPKEDPAAKRARLQRELARLDKKYPVETKSEAPKEETKSSDLDYGQKAFLMAAGIKGTDEIGLVKTFMKNTGKSLDEALESKYLQAELKDMRDAVAVKAATPNGTKRSGQTGRDSVEFWLAKGELPPADQRELRTKVVNARLKSETNSNTFTDNPVVR